MRRGHALCLALAATAALVAAVEGCGGTNDATPPPDITVGSATAFHGDATHAGASAGSVSLGASAPSWSRLFPGKVSHVVVSGPQAYIVSIDAATFVKRLHAIDLATGADLRPPVDLQTFGANLAAGDAQVVVSTFEGFISAYESGSGAALWKTRLPGSSGFTGAPVVVSDRVFVNNASIGETVALDAGTGRLLWSTSNPSGGSPAPPAVSNGLVYLSATCHIDALSAQTGMTRWSQSAPCNGGGGETVAVANGRVYSRDFFLNDGTFQPNMVVRDALTGAEVSRSISGDTDTPTLPALTGSEAYVVMAGALFRLDLLLKTSQWRFDGDRGSLITAPLVVGNRVFAAGAGTVYAVDAQSGALLWSAQLPRVIEGRDEEGTSLLRGLAWGGGYLFVPASDSLTAWRLTSQ